MGTPNIVIGFLTVCVSLVFYIYTFSFPDIDQGFTGPGTIPTFYCILAFILGVILMIKGWIEKRKDHQKKAIEQKHLKLVLLFMGMFVLYVLGFIYLGFYLSTILFLIVCLLVTRIKKPMLLIGIPLGTIVFIYIVFERILRIVLPSGIF